MIYTLPIFRSLSFEPVMEIDIIFQVIELSVTALDRNSRRLTNKTKRKCNRM